MKRPITVTDILNSVEFELLQHTLMQDNVADGIQRLRTYQADARTELLGHGKSPSVNAAIDVQLNTNEMVLTLLQVMNERVEAVQHSVRQAAFLKQHTPSLPAGETQPQETQPISHVSQLSSPFSASWPDLSDAFDPSVLPEPSQMSISRYVTAREAELLSARSLDEYLNGEPPVVQMDVRQSSAPLFGGLLNRIRRALHELVLFYVNKAVKQQADVNHAYGALLQELIDVNRAQALEIQELRSRLAQLAQPAPDNQSSDHRSSAEQSSK